MESDDSEQTRSLITDTRGKHRILAELKRLEQEARFLQVSPYTICFYICVCIICSNFVVGSMIDYVF